jgi:uncharacterized protein YprB with RNaseH-like and TPR domain
MDLRRRLARLDRMTRRDVVDLDAVDTTDGGAPDTARGAPPEAPPAELGLREESTGAGPCWVREWREAPPAVPDALPDLTGLLSRHGDSRPGRGQVLLVDTETTGLAGGTGTLAFLVGVAWWEGSELVVRQLFLPGPGREAALLAALAEWAAGFAVVVTYNGASFDLPLLRTRALMNRRADPLAHLLSWDLLPAARRLWGRSLPDCRQQTVESVVCGLVRGEGDIEGARIPEVWRAWLSGGDTEELLCVLRHNRRDLFGMACILERLCGESAALAAEPAAVEDWRRAWALARVAERRRDDAAAARWLAAALDAGGGTEARAAGVAFAVDAVRILKRARRWEDLERLLHAEIAAGAGAWAHREAAILYEHRLPRLEQALRHAGELDDPGRLARLQRRLARVAGAAVEDES